jgi:hypothetical protein
MGPKKGNRFRVRGRGGGGAAVRAPFMCMWPHHPKQIKRAKPAGGWRGATESELKKHLVYRLASFPARKCEAGTSAPLDMAQTVGYHDFSIKSTVPEECSLCI